MEHQLLFNGLSNGLFISNLDIKKINSLKLKLNNNIFINLDKYNIKTFVRELNDTNFYLSFSDNLDFTNKNYDASINFSRFDSITLELDYNMEDLEVLNFKIGLKSLNKLRIISGMAGLVFSTSNIHQIRTNTNIRREVVKENKRISGDTFCAIKHADIEDNEEYYSCDCCNKSFSYNVSRQWIEQRKKCPMCVQPWTNFTIYVNSG